MDANTAKDKEGNITDEVWISHPSNPHNWSPGKKWFQMFAVCYINMWMNMTGPAYIAGRQYVAKSLNVGTTLSILPTPMSTLGLAIGPIIAAPMSESIGRLPVYQTSTPIAVMFLLGSGLTNHIYGVAVCRFFVGLFGGAASSVGPGGTATDIFRPHERALPLGLFNFMGFAAVPLGFLVSGLSIHYTGDWRYTAWAPSTFAVIAIVLLLCLQETRRDAIERRLAHADDSSKWRRFQENLHRTTQLKYLTILQRPFRMLLKEPVVTAIGVYTSFSFAVVYGMLAAAPYMFQTVYGFQLAETSLTWIVWIIGFLTGASLVTYLQFKLAKALRHKETRDQYLPEWTLKPAMIGSPLVPIGLFSIAWTARPSVHWIVPVIAMGVYAAGTLLCFNSSLTYLAQYYGPQYGASATGGARMLSFYLGIAFPLFALPMFETLGIAWSLSLLGFLGLALLPTPFLLHKFGPRLRARTKAMQSDATPAS
ncbi:Putative major facilitator superfamily, MFS transporter superfamily [Septoria linicola]|uniref:Major facilitator superfamily, MFS transporter superfamily n=1 Tax=Septoria linicola TaxID=215465 RepID=A0A9Q9EDF2_9PEZI|nr:Putative major facilitator superfamily, MFS transporter superfamily [Septoria linicola]